MVLHGENDQIVPFDSARDMAEDADATLYRVPGAYHSWMIANPRHGADSLRQLLNGELGDVLRETADVLGIKDWRDAAGWDRALVEPDAWVRELTGDEVDELGAAEPEHVELELIRRAERPRRVQEVPPARRAYRRWFRRPAARSQTTVQPDANTA